MAGARCAVLREKVVIVATENAVRLLKRNLDDYN